MNNENNYNAMNDGIGGIDAEIASVSRALDRLGQVERDSAPADLEARMAATTMFALSASRASAVKHERGGSRLWLRLAAAVALISAGAIAWTMTRTPSGLGSGQGTEIARTTPTPSVASEGDDSEVYSLVALALDGGIGSDVDYLASDASDLHDKIGESPSLDDLLDGSTM
jgi:hypothetical protein